MKVQCAHIQQAPETNHCCDLVLWDHNGNEVCFRECFRSWTGTLDVEHGSETFCWCFESSQLLRLFRKKLCRVQSRQVKLHINWPKITCQFMRRFTHKKICWLPYTWGFAACSCGYDSSFTLNTTHLVVSTICWKFDCAVVTQSHFSKLWAPLEESPASIEFFPAVHFWTPNAMFFLGVGYGSVMMYNHYSGVDAARFADHATWYQLMLVHKLQTSCACNCLTVGLWNRWLGLMAWAQDWQVNNHHTHSYSESLPHLTTHALNLPTHILQFPVTHNKHFGERYVFFFCFSRDFVETCQQWLVDVHSFGNPSS